MSKFVLTAQLKLQAPNNTRQVVNQMRSQLSGLNVPVQVSGASTATKQIKQVTAATKQAAGAADNMGRSFGLALKRFAAFTVASRAVSLFTNTLAGAVDEAIDFQRELVKISQVTGKSMSSLRGLNQEITNLSTSLGTSSKELLGATRILAQAGVQANDLKVALEALAKTTLAPTFEDINKTAEGAVAILAQFGKGVGALKEQLGAINAVAGQFAVESGDLIGAIRRTGGVFKAAGGDLNEFLGLFTSIRATTRESAESIATGLRTILTRIQRPATIQYLKELGVTLTDVNGRFVGPFEAVKRLSKALADVPAGDLKFVQIAEQLGGFRQIGKVIPLLQEFETAELARQAAVAGAASLDKDAATAQQSLAVQIQKTREEFQAFIRGLTETSSFQAMVGTTLKLASAFIQVADALKPLIPLIGAFAAFKFAGGLASFGKGAAGALRGIQTKAEGGRVMGFARGGMVPGTGNSDTVPAMLSPGEFVIRKSSVKKIGAGRLAGMNKYASGGTVRDSVSKYEQAKALMFDADVELSKDTGEKFAGKKRFTTKDQIGYDRVKDIGIDVGDYPKRRSAGFRAYRTAVKANDAKARGEAFELVAREINKGIVLAEGAVSSDGDAPSSRMDAIYKGIPREIKSRQKRISDGELGKKVVGAAISPRSTNIDNRIQDILTGQLLTSSGDDIALGQAGLIYDDSDLAKIKRSKDVGQKGSSKLGAGGNRNKLRATKRFFGGLIQRFAAGGIVNTTKVGAAILDPDDPSKSSLPLGNIGKTDVYKNRRLKADKLAQKNLGQYYNGRTYTLTRKGLNQKTSDSFKKNLLDGMAVGLDHATELLGADLGIGGQKMDEASKSEFISHMAKRGAPMGNAFEAAVQVLDGKGTFKADQVSAPFDFPGGIAGGLANNYSGLPSSWVDAKTSYTEANKNNFRTKIANQIADEFYASGLNKAKKKAASGGSISGADTVPALLTPGEFVVNKKSAQSIGYSNLSRMNTKGVTGFNKGGPVGFNRGGKAGGGGMDLMSLQIGLGAVGTALTQFGDKSKEASDRMAGVTIASEKISQLLMILPLIAMGMRKASKGIDNWVNKVTPAAKSAEFFEKSVKEAGKESGGEEKTTISNATITIQKATLQKGGGGGGGAAGGAPEMTKEEKAQHLNKRVSQQKAVMAKRQENLTKIQQDRGENEKETANAQKSFSKANAEKQRLDDRKSKVSKNEQAQAKNVSSEQNKRDAIQKEVTKNEQGKVNANKELDRSTKKDDANRANLKTQQDVQRQAEFKKSEAERKQTSGFGKVESMESAQGARSARIAGLEQKQGALAAKGGRGTVADPDKKGVKLSGKDINRELAQLRGEFSSTEKSIAQTKKSVDGYDSEIKGHQKTVDNSKKAQAGLSSAIEKSSSRKKKAEHAASAATEKHTKSIGHLNTSNKKLQKGNKELAGTRKKLASVTAQSKAADKKFVETKKAYSGAMSRGTRLTSKAITEAKKLDSAHNRLASMTKKAEAASKGLIGVQSKVSGSTKKLGTSLGDGQAKMGKLRKSISVLASGVTVAGQKTAKLGGSINKNLVRRIPVVGRRLASLNSRGFKLLSTRAKAADIQFQRLARSIQNAGKNAGKPSLMRRGIGAVGKGATALGGMGMMVGQIGTAVASGVAEFGNRKADIAVGAGNVGGAAKAGEAASLAEGMGRLFTGAGLVEMMFGEPGSFVKKVAQQAKNAGADRAGAAAQTQVDATMAALNTGDIGEGQAAEQIGAASGGVIKQLNSETKSGIKADKATQTKQRNALKANEKQIVTTFSATATTMQDVRKKIDGMSAAAARAGGTLAMTEDELMQVAKSAFAVAEAQRAMAKANFDNLKVLSAFGKANNAVSGFINSLQTGSSTLAQSIATVEAASQNIGMGAEGSKALDSIRKRIIDVAAGGDETTAQGQAINRQFSRADSANEFMASIQGRVSGLDISSGNEGAAKTRLESALLAGVEDADIRKAIQGQIEGMGDIRGKDASDVIAQISAGLGPMRDGALKAAKALLQHEQTILKLTAQRRQAELAYIDTQRQVIDAQLKFAKTFEEFGGSKLTSDQKLSANLAKFNIGARDAGVKELKTGSVSDIQSVAANIQSRMNQQQVDRATGGFADVQGVDADRIKETNASIKSLVGFIQSQIQATKDQIAVIEKRNAAEQSSIDALMSGNVAGFIDGQGAAGAADALRSGDADLASMFSVQDMGQALKQLKAEGADASVLQRAGEIAANAAGLDDRAGQVLTGTTGELNSLRNQGQALAAAGGQVSNLLAESAKMEVATAEMAIENANIIFKNEMEKAGRAQERADAGLGLGAMAKGGMVYASRGMFIPRGTDTVPAMLTPGEFVVNRAAVQRGNNLQMLRAMNGNGATVNAGPAGPAAMSGGGQVGYYMFGDLVQSMGSFTDNLPNLKSIFDGFASAVTSLSSMQLDVSINKPIDVNVRLLNDNILKVIDDKIAAATLDAVAEEIPKYKTNISGDSVKSPAVLP